MSANVSEIPGLHWNPDGYSALSGVLLNLAQELDAIFLSWARELGCVEHEFPSFISLGDLQPLSYLKSFPHLATFAFSHNKDSASLASFALANHAEIAVSGNSDWEPSRHLLTPAACYHFYPRLAGSRLEQSLTLTTVCSCHRREVAYAPLARQWCFSMRELVCIGGDDDVERFAADCQRRINVFAAGLGISAHWKTASDPFFNPENNAVALAQQLDPTKLEFTLADGLAIGSINRHRSYFGECYDINFRGKSARSACVAFGLERWLLAFVQVHGDNPEHWLLPVKAQQ